MSLLYFISKFSNEVIILEVFLLGLLMTMYFGYLLFKKRKYGAAKNMIPDNVVKAFLTDILSNTEGFKNQLFGENFKIDSSHGNFKMPSMGTAAAGDSADVSAIKNQLMVALSKQDELGKAIANLNKEKSDLETKLKTAASAAPAAAGGGGGDNKELLDKLAKLEAKLSEYEVIEDDLANLKKYQQENKQLKEQLAAGGGGAPAPTATAAPTPAPTATPAAATPPAPAESPIAKAEEAASQADAAKNFEGLVDKIEESLTPATPPAGASVNDTVAAASPATPPAATAAPAAEVPAGDKSDADLLNEFEKMLNS